MMKQFRITIALENGYAYYRGYEPRVNSTKLLHLFFTCKREDMFFRPKTADMCVFTSVNEPRLLAGQIKEN